MAEIPTPATGYSAQTKKRPLGVTVISVLMMLGAIMNLVGTPSNFVVYGVAYGGIYVVLGLVDLIVGIALFQLIPWSRMVAIIMQLIGLILGLVVAAVLGGMLELILPGASMFMFIAMVPSVIISLIVILYLMQGSVKASFESGEW
jgi:hypothetical protein